MTEPERVDGRVRDLAALCTRHGTPCADGLLAEIGRLRSDLADAERVREDYEDERDEANTLAAHLGTELERTEGDLGVAIREAAAARGALFQARPWVVNSPRTPERREILGLVDAALDQRLTR